MTRERKVTTVRRHREIGPDGTPAAAGGSVRVGPWGFGAIGATLVAGFAAAAVAGLEHQATVTARLVEQAALAGATAPGAVLDPGVAATDLPVPHGDGRYPPRSGRDDGTCVHLVLLGDSTAVGYGCTTAAETPGVLLARRLADALDRPVQLRGTGLVGCGAADLARQVDLAGAADVAVITVGANDIRDKVPPGRSAELLGRAVATLRARRIPVVVGSCPDFGVIPSLPQPLRLVLRAWSHRLAQLQERAATAAGGVAVPLGRLVSPDFAGHRELFAVDGFHPSAAGYARAVDALFPAVLAAVTATPAAH